jgi:hypothetical protein
MNIPLNIELRGPCTEDSGLKPELNQSIALVDEHGQIKIMTVSGVAPTPDGVVLYATGGEKVAQDDCYLLHVVNPMDIDLDS